MTGPRRRLSRLVRWGCLAAVAVMGVALVMEMSGHPGTASARVGLERGAAWFMSPATGQLALVDGSTGVRIVKVDVAEPAHDVSVVQFGDDGIVVDRTTGEVRRVDGSTFAAGPKQLLATPGDPHLQVVANASEAWAVVQRGTLLQRLGPDTLEPLGPPAPFRGTVSSAVITSDGVLWAASDDGTVVSYHDAERRTEHTIEGSASARLVLVDDTPTVVDPVADRVAVLDPHRGTPARLGCLGMNDPELLLAGSSSAAGAEAARAEAAVFAVDPAGGTLSVAVPGERRKCSTPVVIGPPGAAARYGRPVEHRGRVYIPDRLAGTAVVVELGPNGQARLLGTVDLGVERDADVHLSTHGGFVWFDDRTNDDAGVIYEDLTALRVSKSDADPEPVRPGDESAPDQQPDDSDELACRAVPNVAAPGQTVSVTVVPPARGQLPPNGWTWQADGLPAPPGNAAQIQLTWSQAGGPYQITARHRTGPAATCSVTVTTSPPPPPDPPPDTPPDTPPASVPPDPDPGAVATTTPATTTTAPASGAAPAGDGGTAATTTVLEAVPTTTAPATLPEPPPGTIEFSPRPPRTDEPVTFTYHRPERPESVAWTFEGGSPSTSTDAVVTWSRPGTYTVQALATDGSTVLATTSVEVVQRTIEVPAIVTSDVASARAALETAGLAVGTITEIDRLAPAGRVLTSSLAAGTPVVPGTVVDLTVSSGRGELGTIAGAGPQSAGFAGDGGPAASARLNSPTQVLAAPDGSLFIADNYNHRVRRIDPAGVITTVAGSGTKGFSGDTGPATAAQLARPRAMALDGTGNLYIADIDNQRVRRVSPGGVITTVAGGGTGPADGRSGPTVAIGVPSGLAIDPVSGDLFIQSRTHCRIYGMHTETLSLRNVVGTTGCSGGSGPSTVSQLRVPLSDVRFRDLVGMAFDDAGRLYVAEGNGHRIRRLDLVAGLAEVVAGTGASGFNGDGPALQTQMSSPDAIAIEGDMILFLDWGNNRVRRLTPDGRVVTVAGDGTGAWTGDGGAAPDGRLNLSGNGESAGLTIAPDGSVYIADPANHVVRRIR